MDSRNRIASYKKSDRRLLSKVFESKPIKRGGRNPSSTAPRNHSNSQSTLYN